MEAVKVARHLFHVVTKSYLSPHYISVQLQGEGAQDFAQCTLGANNKILLHQDVQQHPKFKDTIPTWDEFFGAEKPLMRTYTHRAIDLTNNTITIDFVFHGDNGPASHWAHKAAPGDVLGVAMKLKSAQLVPPADWYFLIGDATAIPVLSCIIESLPNDVKGKCIIEVATPEDIHPGLKHEGIEIEWLINPHPEQGSPLANEVKKVNIEPSQNAFAYIAAEYATVKDLRWYFREELGWNTKQFYAYSYWKAGEAEDKSTADRQAEKNG